MARAAPMRARRSGPASRSGGRSFTIARG
jgi:hypothetical protein